MHRVQLQRRLSLTTSSFMPRPIRVALAALLISTSLIAAVKFDPAEGQIRGMIAVAVLPGDTSSTSTAQTVDRAYGR